MLDRERRCGELWTLGKGGQVVVVLGNCVAANNTIWCAIDETGEQVRGVVSEMSFKEARAIEVTVEKCQRWARAGNASASWWCGWWFEGVNHPKSVWYCIAALRREPEKHGWALSRIVSDSYHAAVCEGVAEPDLAFLNDIAEFRQVIGGVPKWGREQFLSVCDEFIEGSDVQLGSWQEAIRHAEEAIHIPAKEIVVENDPRFPALAGVRSYKVK